MPGTQAITASVVWKFACRTGNAGTSIDSLKDVTRAVRLKIAKTMPVPLRRSSVRAAVTAHLSDVYLCSSK